MSVYSKLWFFHSFSNHVQMWELDHKEGWAPKNWCFQTVVLEKTLESSLDSKEIKPLNPKGNQLWIFIVWVGAEIPNTLATWCEELTHWKRPWCWETLKAGGEGGDRGWDGWMAVLTQWTWVWANSERQWRTGKQFMGLQRVGHNLVTEQQHISLRSLKHFVTVLFFPNKTHFKSSIKMIPF